MSTGFDSGSMMSPHDPRFSMSGLRIQQVRDHAPGPFKHRRHTTLRQKMGHIGRDFPPESVEGDGGVVRHAVWFLWK